MIEADYLQDGRSVDNGLNEAAFVRLYESSAQGVLNYICYRLGPEEAEDLTAQVFARLWAKRNEYETRKGPLTTWLWAIVRNAINDKLRDKQRKPITVELPTQLAGTHSLFEDVAQLEEWRKLKTAIQTLHPLDQDIIALRFGAGHTNRDIAGLVGLNEANVAQRLRRALRKLRLALEERDGNHD
jgi:RNA polymerase sigma-70 factor (ECF subfamily)